jgi:hypothetical protein
MLRISLLCALVACGKSASEMPRTAEPTAAKSESAPAKPDPAPAADPALRADVDMICGAAKATGGHDLMSVGPYIAEHMKTDLLANFFANIRTTSTLDDFVTIVRGAMAKTGVETCDTIDALTSRR